MPLDRYGVLVGRVTDKFFDKDDSPHMHMLVSGEEQWDISVNVQSGVFFSTQPRDGVPPNQVLFLVKDPITHPLLDKLAELEPGYHTVAREPGGIAVDYIRSNLFDPAEMNPLPASAEGPDNDLFEKMGFYVDKAIADEKALVYAFGEPWPKSDRNNRRFGFTPDQGIHDVHMNQGNDPAHTRDDGVYQDGALFFRFCDRWVGVFVAFQAQCWHTDDTTGAAQDDCPKPDTDPPEDRDSNNGTVRIVAVTPNPFGRDQGNELVHLINVLDKDRDLAGWRIVDSRKNGDTISGVIKGNDTLRVQLTGRGCQLSNSGDTISLLDEKGRKVDGISYTRDRVRRGLTLITRS